MNRSVIITPGWQVSIWNKVARLSESVAMALAALGREVMVITPQLANGGAKQRWQDGIHIIEVEDNPRGAWKKNAENALMLQRGIEEIFVIDSGAWPAARAGVLADAQIIGIALFGQSTQGERIASGKTDILVAEENEFITQVGTLLVNNEILRNRIHAAFDNRAVGKLEMSASIPPEVKVVSDACGNKRNEGEIVVIGKIGPELGLEKLIRVMPDIPWMRIKVMGMPYSNLDQTRMEALIARWGLQDRITFTGHARTREVLTAIRQAEILVMPSQVEYFGYSVMDAMLMETPVIASAVNIHPELITDSEDGMLFQNQEELRYALNTFHEMPELRQACASRAKEKIKSERSVLRMASSLTGLIA